LIIVTFRVPHFDPGLYAEQDRVVSLCITDLSGNSEAAVVMLDR